MNAYRKAKDNARNKAIEWRLSFDGKCLSWSEVAYYGDYFYSLAKRYGLVKEFRENGII